MSDKVLVPSIAKGRPGKRANPSSNLMNTSNKKRALCKGDREVLEGYFCFPLNSDGPTFQPRSPYTASKKAEVNEMRDIGACLRCQRLKKLVSSSPLKIYIKIWLIIFSVP
jgi:hypothetical protein